MTGASVEVKGFAELMETFDKLAANTGRRILQASCRKAMVPVLEEAQRLVPRDTGLLRDGIAIRNSKSKGDAPVGEAGLKVFGPHKFIWHLVEFGVPHRGIAAQPFLRPALRKCHAQAIRILKEELHSAIQKAIKRQDAIPPSVREAKAIKLAQRELRRGIKSLRWKLGKMARVAKARAKRGTR